MGDNDLEYEINMNMNIKHENDTRIFQKMFEIYFK